MLFDLASFHEYCIKSKQKGLELEAKPLGYIISLLSVFFKGNIISPSVVKLLQHYLLEDEEEMENGNVAVTPLDGDNTQTVRFKHLSFGGWFTNG